MDRDRPVLAKLLFCFMYLANKIDETLSRFWHSLLRPVCELKLPYCSRLSILETEHRKREKECTDPTLLKWNTHWKYEKKMAMKNG